MDFTYAPTVNEIVLNRLERNERRDRRFNRFNTLCERGYPEYDRNDIVSFIFNGLVKVGRVTTVIGKGGQWFYNIETALGQWFQKIEQADVRGKISV